MVENVCIRAYMRFDLIYVHFPHMMDLKRILNWTCFLTYIRLSQLKRVVSKELKCLFMKIHLCKLMLVTVRLNGDVCGKTTPPIDSELI